MSKKPRAACFKGKTDELAQQIGEDVGRLRESQDKTDRRLADLRTRMAKGQLRKYEPVQAPALPVDEPKLPQPQGIGIGMDARTGGPLSGWAHVQQSIGKILMTRIGERVMFRDFGADVPNLIDANATPKVIMQVFVAIAEALDKWEPRFRLTHVALTQAGPDGRFTFQLAGVYFPRGHLEDFSASEDRAGDYVVRQSR